jgi:hypothetical protein
MSDIKKGDKILCLIPGMNSTQEAEITDVLETCVQVRFNRQSFSNLLTIDKNLIIDKILETSIAK